MKVFRIVLIVMFALLLSGCYTQLQYSQKMNKITDENPKGYSWNGEEKAEDAEEPREDEAEYQGENLPIYYKDYEYAEKYKDCACGPYNEYNFYGSDWYGYDPYFSDLSLSFGYFHRWHSPYRFGHRFYPHYPRFGFSLSFGWGSPYHRFYDPFYDPFYDYYWYRYHPYAYYFGGYPYGHYGYYYGNYGYFYGFRDNDSRERDVRYGPRSIGTNRVVNDGDRSRSRSAVTGRTDSRVTSTPTVRTRSSVGNTRTRSSSDRNTGSKVRSRSSNRNDSGSGTSRSRSRDNLQQQDDAIPIYIDRTDEDVKPVIIDRERFREIRSRSLNDNTVRSREKDLSNRYIRSRFQNLRNSTDLNSSSQRTRRTFFERMKNFFEDNSSRIINTNRTRSNNGTFRSRSTSPSSRSSVTRSSSNTKSRSTVTRSRSSSSDSRSRGSSSRSRSSGGSDRSRDN